MIRLDTSVLVPYFRSDPAITNRLAEAEVAVPATVLGELYFGAEVRAHSERHARDVDSLLDRAQLWSCDGATLRPGEGRLSETW